MNNPFCFGATQGGSKLHAWERLPGPDLDWGNAPPKRYRSLCGLERTTLPFPDTDQLTDRCTNCNRCAHALEARGYTRTGGSQKHERTQLRATVEGPTE